MEKYRLQPLTAEEKKTAEKEHKIVYAFLRQYGYPVSSYYDIAVMGYLKGIQVYHRRADLRREYSIFYICWKYMKAEISNHHRQQKAQKRVPTENICSLDFDYMENENFYNCIGGRAVDEDFLETENIIELFGTLTELQRKIVRMKMDGYSNREVFTILDMPSSSYYKEMKKMKIMVMEKMAE